MKHLKSIFAVALVLAMLLSGCGNKAEQNNNATSEPDGTKSKPEYVIRYSNVLSEADPTTKSMQWLKTWLEEQSNGKVSMEIYSGGQLYDDSTEIDAICSGNIDMISTYISKLTAVDPEMQYSIVPYLFNSPEEMVACYSDPDVQSTLFKKLDDIGISVMGAFYAGDTYIFSTDTPIHSVKDFKGMKVRENGGNMISDMYASVDASVVTISYAELYTSMQTKLANACTCTNTGCTGIGLQDVVDYCADMGYQYCCYLVQFNTKTFESYPKDVQDLIKEGISLASEKCLEFHNDLRSDCAKTIEAGGCEIYTFTEENKVEAKEIWGPIAEQYISDTWKNTVSEFQNNYNK